VTVLRLWWPRRRRDRLSDEHHADALCWAWCTRCIGSGLCSTVNTAAAPSGHLVARHDEAMDMTSGLAHVHHQFSRAEMVAAIAVLPSAGQTRHSSSAATAERVVVGHG
jgi:hypothetical protein